MSPFAEELAQVVLEEHVPVVTTGAGSPGKFIDKWKEAGIRVVPVVASVAYAKRMESLVQTQWWRKVQKQEGTSANHDDGAGSADNRRGSIR